MTKTELMETYTVEQLAEMVEKFEKYSEIKENAKKQVGERLKLIDFSKNPYSVICDLKDLIYEFAKGCDDEDMNNLEYYKRRISELEEECVKKQNEINQLEEGYGRMKARVDTYVNYILPRATEEARKMIDNHQYPGIRIATCEEWATRRKDNQSEVEKYRKAFEGAKKERDCQIAEYQKKIEELKVENAELHCEMQAMKVFPDEIPTEPIKVAEMLITAKGECEPLHIGNYAFEDTYRIFDVSGLRQIAEHLLIYCNHNKEE